MKQGYIKLYRKVMESPVWNDPHYLKLWMYCLLKATHKEREVIVGNQVINLKPGQFVTGRKILTNELNEGMEPRHTLSESSWWRYLNNLEKWGMLNIKKTNKYSVISIIKWNEYQENEHQLNIKKTGFLEDSNSNHENIEQQKNGENNCTPSDLDTNNDELEQQMNNKWTSNEHQMNTNKNVKNDKNDKNIDYTPQIKDLVAYYSVQIPGFIDLNKKYWDVIRETRKSGEVSKSVIYKTMEKWKKYPPVVIEYALKSHILLHAGKREEYTIGIMRRTNEHEARRGLIKLKNKGGGRVAINQPSDPGGPQYDYGF